MERVLFTAIAVLSIFIIIFFLFSGELVSGYINSRVLLLTEEMKNNNISFSYSDRKYSFFRIIFENLKVNGEENYTADFNKVVIKPDIFASLFKLDLVLKLSAYHGSVLIDLKDKFKFKSKELSVSRFNFYNTDFDIKNLDYNNLKTDIKLTGNSGYINLKRFSSNFMKIISDNIKLNIERAGSYFSGKLVIKKGSTVKYENFLKDLKGMRYISGEFDLDLNFSVKNTELLYEGDLFFYDTAFSIKGIPVNINEFNGKVIIKNDLRKFSDMTLAILDKKFNFNGFRKKKDSMDINIVDLADENNRLHIFGHDVSLKYTGKYNYNGILFDISKDEFIKINLESKFINGVLFLSSEDFSGDFRLAFRDYINIYGKLNIDIENKIINTSDGIIKINTSTFPFELNYDKKLKFNSKDLLNLSYEPESERIVVDFINKAFRERFEGILSLTEKRFDIRSENGFFKGDLNNFNDCLMNYRLHDLNIENSFILKGVDLKLFKNEKDFFIKGKLSDFSYLNLNYSDVKIDMDFNKNINNISSGSTIIEFGKDRDNYYGELSGFYYEKNISGKILKTKIEKAKFFKNKKGFKFIPVKAEFDIDNNRFEYVSGEIEFSKNILEGNKIEFLYKKDKLNLDFKYDEEGIEYNINMKGNSKFEFADFFVFKNKILQLSGKNDDFNGYILFEDAFCKPISEGKIKGKLIIDKTGLLFDNTQLNISDNFFDIAGKIKSTLEFNLKIGNQEKKQLIINNDIIDLNIYTKGDIILFGTPENIKIRGDIKVDSGKILLKKVSKKNSDLKFNGLALRFHDLDFEYGTNRFVLAGDLNLDTVQSKNNRLNIEVSEGYIDILGNRFDLIEGKISSLHVKSDIQNKIINLSDHTNRLDTEYKLQKDTEYELDISDIESISRFIWVDLLFKKEFSENVVFASLKGTADDKNIYFYSEPELSGDEINQLLMDNSILSILDDNTAKEKILNLIGFEKTFLKKFTKALNFDSVDLKKEDDMLNLNLTKDFSDKFSIKYKAAVLDEAFSYELKYRFNNRFQFENENNDRDNTLKLKWKINF